MQLLTRGRGLMLVTSLAALILGAFASTSSAATPPSLTLGNDANQDGAFSPTESVAKPATYPDVVTFQITFNAGSARSHTITSLTDTAGADLSGCPSVLPINSVTTCTYTVTVSGPQSTPITDAVTMNFDGNALGHDTLSATSTVLTPAMSIAKSSTTHFVGAIGQVVPYSYLVTNTGSAPLSGVSVADNKTDAAPGCPATTLAVGASMTCTGQHTVTAADLAAVNLTNLATASSNEAPDATATLSIPIAPSATGGNFVIGNLNSALTTPVTFWGAQWWKLNSLTGGSAPASFKGFEDMPAAPTCGQTWTTDPGNSTPPPAGPLPPFMTIIVSSAITQTGSTIAGDTQHIVVVQTNSGYAPNPGHAGTGTVVATIC